MLATSGIVKLIAKKTILTVKQKMKKRAGDSENPNPAAQRDGFACFIRVARLRDYCTFFAAAAGAPAVDSTMLAEVM
jgi:hypothetical protein